MHTVNAFTSYRTQWLVGIPGYAWLSLLYSRNAFVFICLRSVYIRRFKQKFLEPSSPLPFLVLLSLGAKSLTDAGCLESTPGTWMEVKDSTVSRQEKEMPYAGNAGLQRNGGPDRGPWQGAAVSTDKYSAFLLCDIPRGRHSTVGKDAKPRSEKMATLCYHGSMSCKPRLHHHGPAWDPSLRWSIPNRLWILKALTRNRHKELFHQEQVHSSSGWASRAQTEMCFSSQNKLTPWCARRARVTPAPAVYVSMFKKRSYCHRVIAHALGVCRATQLRQIFGWGWVRGGWTPSRSYLWDRSTGLVKEPKWDAERLLFRPGLEWTNNLPLPELPVESRLK